MRTEENKLVPEVRFRGVYDSNGEWIPFDNAWEQRKVREVTDRYDNLRIPVAASLRVAGTTPYYGANGIQDYVEGYTHDGEFILVAEDGANDLKNYPVNCVKGRIWVNNHAHVLQGKCACADNQFLAYAISQADIESLLVGGGRAKLNAETLMDIELLLPSKDEQIQIGSYLAQLDHLITLAKSKCDAYVQAKKSMMQKLFSKQVRFKKADGSEYEDWMERPLSDLAVYKSCSLTVANTSKTGECPVYDAQKNIVGYTIKSSNDEFIGIVKDGAGVGRTHLIPANSTCLGTMGMIISNDETNVKWLYYVYQTLNFEKYVIGGAIPHLYYKDYAKIKIDVPSNKSEQIAIANCLSNYDNLIAAATEELEGYKLLKKSMLQKMFV